MAKVVVIGGGNAGSIVANRLQNKGIDVTVIEPSDLHLYQPGIIDVAFGEEREEEIIRPVNQIIKSNIIKDKATKVDIENHSVYTSRGLKIEYDYLVIAAGAENKKIEGFPQWHSIDGIGGLKEQINKFDGKKIVVGYSGVIKCPAAPFEFAFFLKQKFPKAEVTLVNPVSQPPDIQKPMAELLGKRSKELGINVIRGFKIKDIDKDSKIIYSEDGQNVSYDMALLDTPIRAGQEFENLTDKTGFIPVDKYTLKYKDYDNVFAVGDITNIMTPPKTGAIAHFGAKIIADNIYADVNGYEKKKFDGSIFCAVYGGFGKGLLIRMNYEKSYATGPFSIFYIVKKSFIRLYWNTLTGNFII